MSWHRIIGTALVFTGLIVSAAFMGWRTVPDAANAISDLWFFVVWLWILS
jgi:hypothetical protein